MTQILWELTSDCCFCTVYQKVLPPLSTAQQLLLECIEAWEFLPPFFSLSSLHPSVPFLLPPFYRDSIIPAGALNNQVVLSQGGSHHADLCKYSLATSSQVTFIPPTHTNPALNGGVGVEGDYMNRFPEGLLHTYSNEGDLLQQVSELG